MLTRPHLWTFIRVTGSFTNRLMVNEMIERSGLFPLSVLFTETAGNRLKDEYGGATFDVLGIASLVSDYSERIQELGVVLRGHQASLVLDTLSKSRIPVLEKLWIHDGSTERHDSSAWVRVFDAMIPPLRVLHAHRLAFSWLPFEGLERLDLMYGPSPPLSALLHTIRHSPLLRALSLCTRSADQRGDNRIEDEPRALLPCLRQLQLQVEPVYDAALSVLPYISFPVTTDVQFTFWGRFQSSIYESCDSVEELAANVEHVDFTLFAPNIAWISSDTPSITVKYAVAQRNTDMHDPPEHHDLKQPIARLCEGFLAVPFPALTSLSIATELADVQLETDRFLLLFGAVPTLVRLRIDIPREHASPLFAALGSLVEDSAGNQNILCPGLKEIAVSWADEPGVDDLWSIERCCHFRASVGARIARLETIAFPQIVLHSLQYSVETIVVTEPEGL